MDLGEVKQKMQAGVDYTRREMAMIRTGRANPALVENIVINAYGGTAKMRVVELGTISVPEPQQLVITPYDQSIIGDVRRDLEAANLGVMPVIDNGVIRMTFPALTTERRLEYVKLLHTRLEDGRVKIRQIRHDKMTELKRQFEAKELTEDDRHRLEKELQELTDEMMKLVEEMGKMKEEELKTL
ncbi:ribosome recycling factor [Candidatus Amesbacteria bacterium RIFCSPHIGHO2_01_FULL_48_32]|uniref:Ribosome recycling factor n=1 Tax=Candidatus Amesbacteria bacterium RIFCSPLOWO2_01_FULL_48_25 TaxID=1797259 RepID=A0A1F4ZBK3_9BACT|nr:MAG: ribosome recycling factor [Candidatus Amesbacteria bacterium RIFCSPHIGHO2_01_FULL_48_32]OGD03652.1 MAG: ribosome recycling factor [Candidatus Amesbacteria bacterium RIFCSPLOWO2_01_FULL_48_25]